MNDAATIDTRTRKVGLRRLARLAEHLERGKLSRDRFNFGVWHQVNCKTAGCAIGECPALWPRHFEFSDIYTMGDGRRVADVILKDDDVYINEEAATLFFALNFSEARHLFLPQHQLPRVYGGKALGRHATRKQVARNMRAFIKYATKHL